MPQQVFSGFTIGAGQTQSFGFHPNDPHDRTPRHITPIPALRDGNLFGGVAQVTGFEIVPEQGADEVFDVPHYFLTVTEATNAIPLDLDLVVEIVP